MTFQKDGRLEEPPERLFLTVSRCSPRELEPYQHPSFEVTIWPLAQRCVVASGSSFACPFRITKTAHDSVDKESLVFRQTLCTRHAHVGTCPPRVRRRGA